LSNLQPSIPISESLHISFTHLFIVSSQTTISELRNNKKKEGKEMNMKLAIIGLFFIVIGFLLGFWFYSHDKGPTVYRIYEFSLEK